MSDKRSLMGLARDALATLRADGFVNAITGLGTSKDKSTGAFYQRPCYLTYQQLEDLYVGNWLARRLVEKLPQVALSGGFKIKGEADSSEILRDFNRINTAKFKEGAFQTAVKAGRRDGLALLYRGYEAGGDVARPLRKGARLKWLDVFDGDEVIATRRYVDPAEENYRMPQTYMVQGNHIRAGLEFHESRALRFSGLDGRHPAYYDEPERTLSVIQPVYEELQRYGITIQGITHLVQESSVSVFRMAGLIQAIASQDQGLLHARMALMNTSKSIANAVMLDSELDEEFTRTESRFSDLPQLLQQWQGIVSGAADTPTLVLFGVSAPGMNNTGYTDLQNYFRKVEDYRHSQLKPALEAILQDMTGKPDLEVEFGPLWLPEEFEAAQARKFQADTDVVLMDANLYTQEEVRQARRRGLPVEQWADEALPTELKQQAEKQAEAALAPPVPPGQEGPPGLNSGNEENSDPGGDETADEGSQE